MSRSPTLNGFRAAFRRPSLVLTEIAWRWAVGATACGLFAFSLVEYLSILPVSNRDLLLLRTRQPTVIAEVVAHILRGTLDRVTLSLLLGVLAATALWMVAAAVGRDVIVRGLLGYFAIERLGVARARSFRALLGLSFLRATLGLAALLGFVGAAILSGLVSPAKAPQPFLVVCIFLLLALLIWLLWKYVSWFLALAAIFAVRDGEDTFGAVFVAVGFYRDRSGPLLAAGTWFGLAHITVFSLAMTAVSFPLSFLSVAPARAVLAIVLIVILAYFAIVDWLHTARLASYVFIAEISDTAVSTLPLPAPPPGRMQPEPATPVQPGIDREELILSDSSQQAMET
jgi:hypothetical protein